MKGDVTYRLDYSLNENSLVIDLGGYEGQWASDVYGRFRCKVLVFEPVLSYARNVRQRFMYNPNIQVFDHALADHDGVERLFVRGGGTSVYRRAGNGEIVEARFVEIGQFFAENNIANVDLIKINIEGSEYRLLEHLIKKDMVKFFGNLQIQFHEYVPNAGQRMLDIQNSLRKTHDLTWQFRFVWENWKRRAEFEPVTEASASAEGVRTRRTQADHAA
ncbi:MAG: FkbM family methyltransferase [Acidiferrobacterales bacterium]